MTRWLTLAAAAEYMGCSPSTVKRHIADGLLNWHKTGKGLRRLDAGEIDSMFQKVERAFDETMYLV